MYKQVCDVEVNGLVEKSEIVFRLIDGEMKGGLYLEIGRDRNGYVIVGMVDEGGYGDWWVLGEGKEMFKGEVN